MHCVAAISLGYKSPLYWYEVHTNDNGKMDAATYKAVYTHVFADIKAFHRSREFIVWEDSDGSHTCKASTEWKHHEGFKTVINTHYCPETNPIEDRGVAAVVKQTIKNNAHSTISDLRQLAEQGFEAVKFDTIAGVYKNMPQRWTDLQASEGRRLNR